MLRPCRNGRAFFQHLWDAQQIGDLAGRQVFLPLSLPDQEEALKLRLIRPPRARFRAAAVEIHTKSISWFSCTSSCCRVRRRGQGDRNSWSFKIHSKPLASIRAGRQITEPDAGSKLVTIQAESQSWMLFPSPVPIRIDEISSMLCLCRSSDRWAEPRPRRGRFEFRSPLQTGTAYTAQDSPRQHPWTARGRRSALRKDAPRKGR